MANRIVDILYSPKDKFTGPDRVVLSSNRKMTSTRIIYASKHASTSLPK